MWISICLFFQVNNFVVFEGFFLNRSGNFFTSLFSMLCFDCERDYVVVLLYAVIWAMRFGFPSWYFYMKPKSTYSCFGKECCRTEQLHTFVNTCYQVQEFMWHILHSAAFKWTFTFGIMTNSFSSLLNMYMWKNKIIVISKISLKR